MDGKFSPNNIYWNVPVWVSKRVPRGEVLGKADNLVPVLFHYGDVIMGAIASQITSLTIVYSTVYSDADQRKHQSSVSLAFVWGIHRGPVNSPHKWPVTREMFPFDDFIMMYIAGLILGLRSANERRRYFVGPTLTGPSAQTVLTSWPLFTKR